MQCHPEIRIIPSDLEFFDFTPGKTPNKSPMASENFYRDWRAKDCANIFLRDENFPTERLLQAIWQHWAAPARRTNHHSPGVNPSEFFTRDLPVSKAARTFKAPFSRSVTNRPSFRRCRD